MDKNSEFVILILLILFVSFIKQYESKEIKTKQKTCLNPTSTTSEFFFSRMEIFGNPQKLSTKQVRSNEMFANISEQEAEEMVEGLYKLSIITYNIFNYGTGKL